jgi:hypothetical protein
LVILIGFWKEQRRIRLNINFTKTLALSLHIFCSQLAGRAAIQLTGCGAPQLLLDFEWRARVRAEQSSIACNWREAHFAG